MIAALSRNNPVSGHIITQQISGGVFNAEGKPVVRRAVKIHLLVPGNLASLRQFTQAELGVSLVARAFFALATGINVFGYAAVAFAAQKMIHGTAKNRAVIRSEEHTS